MNWNKLIRATVAVLVGIVVLWVVAAFVLLHGTSTNIQDRNSPIVTVTTK